MKPWKKPVEVFRMQCPDCSGEVITVRTYKGIETRHEPPIDYSKRWQPYSRRLG